MFEWLPCILEVSQVLILSILRYLKVKIVRILCSFVVIEGELKRPTVAGGRCGFLCSGSKEGTEGNCFFLTVYILMFYDCLYNFLQEFPYSLFALYVHFPNSYILISIILISILLMSLCTYIYNMYNVFMCMYNDLFIYSQVNKLQLITEDVNYIRQTINDCYNG